MKSSLFVLALLMATPTHADDLPELYPFKPYDVQFIHSHVQSVTEDADALTNLLEINARGLNKGSPVEQPWAGSFWPLVQGQIGNRYHEKTIFRPRELLSWETNVRNYKRNRDRDHHRIDEMTEKELLHLSPAEKYDLLLGDRTFDLTNRIWGYVENYGSSKMWNYLSRPIEIPEGFRLPNPNDNISLWEGICHGWALAAGGIERPLNTVAVTLPNGKKLEFLPTDIKALLSLMYANSDVQNNVLMEGRRCNKKKPKKDRYGRYYDDMQDKSNTQVEPPCADVHPAIWHLSVVNLTGVQKRAFVVEIDANSVVNNHPFAGYEIRYFNPANGEANRLDRALLTRAQYRNDPFKTARHPNTHSIVGVEMKMRYTNWTNPRESRTDAAKKDSMKDRTMLYDLELDAAGNVVGGQWRVTHIAEEYRETRQGETMQPDFFWTLPRDYKKYFPLQHGLSQWNPAEGLPAADWGVAARRGHTKTNRYGSRCTLINDVTEDTVQVPCSFAQPRPRPLNNVVMKLLEASRAQ